MQHLAAVSPRGERGAWGNPHVPYRTLTEDEEISRGRTLFFGVQITSVAAASGEVIVRDGGNVTGRLVMRYRVPANETRDFTLPRPILLEQGLYLQVGDNVSECLVLFHPVVP